MSRFEPSPIFRLANTLVTPLISRGFPMGGERAPMALLTVRGRKSGVLRTTPVALARAGNGWFLVAVYGVSDWSQNLEEAGQAEITQNGETTDVEARRLCPQEAAPILRDSIADAPALIRRMASRYFTATVGSVLEDWEQEAVDHPVFLLTPV
jgi:deazaflavin-dependent oxidoreductase (nitroreductase family)